MAALFIILMVVILAVGLLGTGFYMIGLDKKQARMEVERSLEMVPLLIHLPPLSDDTNVGGRDARDVVDETISKAQIVYNIISSTVQKDANSKKFGQRHMSFEIVGAKGFVYFYATVPALLVDVVKQAIVSAYPSAAIQESAEINIFNEVGGTSAVCGGEMILKEPFAFPIATYQELKRDALQSVLGALASLDKEDGVAVQILFRPAHDGWRKTSLGIASKKRKGKYDTKTGLEAIVPLAKQVVTALNKPPEEKKDGKPEDDLSTLDRSVIEAIEDKTRYPGFEVSVRVLVSSNVSQRSQALLQNIVASFSLFDAPGKNGFKFEASSDTQKLINDYLLRTFKKRNNKMVLNAVELATLFHFPDQNKVPTSQVTRQDSKQVDGPRNIPEDGLLLGYNIFRGAKKPIRLSLPDRQRHMYVVGQTGTGKSTYLENLALQDMINGNGFAFVDPHGDTAEKLLAMVPKERTEDIIYFSPADMDYPMGLNLFEFNSVDQKDFIIQEVLNMLYKLYDPTHSGIMGPRYEDMFRNAALAVMADPAGGTFIEIPQLFRDPQFLKQKLAHVKDQTVLDFWLKQFPASQRSNDAGEVTAWFVSKFGAFLSNEMMRNIIGQTKSAFDLRDIMDNKKILLVNLSKGRTGDLNSKLLGMIFVMKFQAAAMSRASIPESERVDFSLYVDEFQNFSTDSFATIMSEARKYHLNLIVANQFTTQLTEEIRDAVFGNMGTIVSFRIGQNDVESLSKYFQPTFDGDDILRVPNYNTIIRTLVGGVPTQPFSMRTLPPLGNPNDHLATALKQLSAVKYGRQRNKVEQDIFARMKTAPALPSKPFASGADAWGSARPAGGMPGAAAPGGSVGSMGSMGSMSSQRPGPTPPPKPASAGSSFLDEWLQKRKQPAPAAPAPAPRAAPAPQPMATQPTAPSPSLQLHSSPAPSQETRQSANKPEPALSTMHHEKVVAPPHHDSQASKNISSSEIDQSEIDKIASELKEDLSESSRHNAKPKVDAPEPKPTAQPATKPTPTEPDELQLPKLPQAPRPAQHPDAEDTIYIDQEGNLVQKNPTE
jgi:hypothetical protein